MQIDVLSSDAMQQLGAKIGALVRGGETIELVGDMIQSKLTKEHYLYFKNLFIDNKNHILFSDTIDSVFLYK